jgi:hypoxanthine phosphoribosyltransferase
MNEHPRPSDALEQKSEGNGPSPVFAHPSEEEFARLFDYYGVQWEYEPQRFAVEWNEAGEPTRYFTPDFYLPEYDLYIEVTTLKQRLITRKHRKIRRLRELYPHVRIKLLNVRDVEALMLKYGKGPKNTAGPK